MALPLILSTPGWVIPGAVIDLDFANERYYGGNVSGSAANNANCQGSLVQGGTSGLVYYAPILDPFGGNGRVLKEFTAFEVRVTRGYGLWSDGIRTNSCLQSRDLTNAAWTKTSCSAARVTGADGKSNSGSSMTASGANATCLQAAAVPARATSFSFAAIAVAGTGYTAGDTITVSGGTFTTAATFKVATVNSGVPQTLTSTQSSSGVNNGNYTVLPANPCATTGGTGTGLTVNLTFNTLFSAYVKRITGSGTVFMTYDGTTYTDITSQINSATYSLVTLAVSTTFAGGTPGFKISTNGDAIAVDHCQVENRAYVTTPQVTTAAAVTGTTDEPAHSDPGFSRPGLGYARIIRTLIANGQPWSMFMSGSGNANANATMLSDGGVTAGCGCSGGTASFAAGSGGGPASATSANTGTFGTPNVNKMCGRARSSIAGGTNGTSVCLNGGAIANSASNSGITAQTSGFTHIGINNNGAGQVSIEGYVKRLTYWNRELTDGEMVNLTRSDSIYGN